MKEGSVIRVRRELLGWDFILLMRELQLIEVIEQYQNMGEAVVEALSEYTDFFKKVIVVMTLVLLKG